MWLLLQFVGPRLTSASSRLLELLGDLVGQPSLELEVVQIYSFPLVLLHAFLVRRAVQSSCGLICTAFPIPDESCHFTVVWL